jgi:predicted NACHT family NTPase
MSKIHTLDRVTELLGRWLSKIRLNNAISYFDINIVSEDLAAKLLNEIYDWNLINLNLETTIQNPSIDLGDKDNGICVQVTSSTDILKIYKTVDSYLEHKLDEIYPNLFILILNQNSLKYEKDGPEIFGRFTLSKSNFEKLKDYANIHDKKNEIEIEPNMSEDDIERIKQLNKDRTKFTECLEDLRNSIVGIVFISYEHFRRKLKKALEPRAFDSFETHINNFLDISNIKFDKKKNIITDKDLILKIKKIQLNKPTIFGRILSFLESNFSDNNISIIESYLNLGAEAQEAITSEIQEKYSIKKLSRIEKKIIPEYLKSQEAKFSSTKTFLHLDQMPFYKVYYPISIQTNSQVIRHVDAIKILKPSISSNNKYTTIIGNAGSGKSTLTKHIFLNAITNYLGIPIVIELRKLNDYNGTLYEYICEKLFFNEIDSSDKILIEYFKLGKMLFLFDGFDEIYTQNKQRITDNLEMFIDKFNTNNFVITSRPGTSINMFHRFKHYEVLELLDNEVLEFVKQQVFEEERANNIIKTILTPKNQNHAGFLRNPLLLSMFIFTFNDYPEIPDQKISFYGNIFRTLYEQHDARIKQGFQRERITRFQRSHFESLLKVFSFMTYFQGKFEFSINDLDSIFNQIRLKASRMPSFQNNDMLYDLQVGISILIEDGLTYRFPHRSLQEYFASAHIHDLSDKVKRKILSEGLDKIVNKSQDSTLNFWELCYEFDHVLFVESFLLPNLNKLFIESESQTRYELFKCIVSKFKLTLTIKSKSKKRSIIRAIQNFLINYNFSQKDMNILAFLDIAIETNFWIEPEKRNRINIYLYSKQIVRKDIDSDDISLFEYIEDLEFINVLNHVGFVDFILKVNENVEKAYTRISNENLKNHEQDGNWLNYIN